MLLGTMGDDTDPLRAIRVVLVSPLHPGNVGSAARAVKNMGLGGLALVALREGRDPGRFIAEARTMAVEAQDVLDQVLVSDELDGALTPSTLIAACSPRGRRGSEPATLRTGALELVAVARDRPVALLFGREDHGLPTRLLARASTTLAIPTSSEYSSLNLAQAVMLVAYELRMAAAAPPAPRTAETASAAELDGLHRDARQALCDLDFLKPHTENHILAELMALLARAAPRPRETELLRGICRQVRWLATRGGRGNRVD